MIRILIPTPVPGPVRFISACLAPLRLHSASAPLLGGVLTLVAAFRPVGNFSKSVGNGSETVQI